jgi:hypothetical protein
MFTIEKPTLILSNYRTGATEFGRQLAFSNHCAWFPEPETSEIPNIEANFRQACADGRPFITKVIVDKIDDPFYVDFLLKDLYVVCIRRRDLLAQIVSYYIYRKTQQWAQLSSSLENYSVPIDWDEISIAIRHITLNEKRLLTSEIGSDKTLFYEDLIYHNENQRQFKTSQPSNYDEIHDAVLKVILNAK